MKLYNESRIEAAVRSDNSFMLVVASPTSPEITRPFQLFIFLHYDKLTKNTALLAVRRWQ